MAAYNAAQELVDRNIKAGCQDKIAYIDHQRSLSYGDLAKRTHRFAHVLAQLGVRREERVALALLDTIDYPVCFLGAIRAGVAPVCLNTLLTSEQYAYMLRDSRARVLFVSSALLPTLTQAAAEAPDLAHIVVVGGAAGAGQIELEAMMADALETPFTVETHADEPAFWLYSSGSTGAPKGVKHVHASLMESARLFGQGVLGLREDDIVHSAAKLFFAYGLGNALSFPLSVGATTILNPDRPTPDSVFAILEKHQPTVFCGVPTLFASMLHDGAHAQSKGSARLRISTSAGEALPEHIGAQWKARFGTDILDGVGSTEMLHIFLSNAPGDIVYGTSGRAVPGYELKLLDEQGAPVADGEVGELYVSGPTSAEGYWNQRAKSLSTFQGAWTRTGDKYTRDASGRYTYCGRADDMFKVSGIWVSPFEVEAALASHACVLEAAVVPATDEDGLLKPKAFVVLKEGADRAAIEAALKDHVKASVGPWKYPRWIEFAQDLPKTATGKIQRFKLAGRS